MWIRIVRLPFSCWSIDQSSTGNVFYLCCGQAIPYSVLIPHHLRDSFYVWLRIIQCIHDRNEWVWINFTYFTYNHKLLLTSLQWHCPHSHYDSHSRFIPPHYPTISHDERRTHKRVLGNPPPSSHLRQEAINLIVVFQIHIPGCRFRIDVLAIQHESHWSSVSFRRMMHNTLFCHRGVLAHWILSNDIVHHQY